MCCADRLCAYFLCGRAQGPAKVIHTRRGQRFRRVFFSPWWGSSPAGAFCCHVPPSVPLCVSPPWRLCAAFSFSGCNFTRLYFSFVLRPSCAYVWRLRPLRFRAWRFPWPSVGRSRGGGACISGRRCSRLGASGAAVEVVQVQAWPEAFRACSAGAGRFFRGSALIAPPGLPGEGACLRQSRWGKINAPPTVFTASGAEL